MALPVQRLLSWPSSRPPALLVVIDTEEEFDWDAPFDPASTAVTNIAQQHLAQEIFARHGVVPTYVIDYPVATTPESRDALRRMADAGACEIGAHLHPWVTPPHEGAVDARTSYSGNLPPGLERRKLEALTDAIAAGFGRRPVAYKAGRYGVGPATAGILEALGYTIDLSVVPYTDFSPQHGPDFSAFPDSPFAVSERLLAIPLSVGFAGRLAPWGPALYPHMLGKLGRRFRLPGIAARLGLLERLRLSPEGHDLADLQRQTRAGIAAGRRLFMLTYHSSSLLPGATAYARDTAGRDAFCARIDAYLRFFRTEIGGRPQPLSEVAAVLTAEARQGMRP